MTKDELEEKIANIEIALEAAARIERMMSDTHKGLLEAKAHWPDYLYDQDDRKDQEPEAPKSKPTAKDIDLYERVMGWLRLLGMGIDNRTVMGKRVIWARANNYSYRQIAFMAGIPPKTCENWYKHDIRVLAGRVSL